MKDMYVSNVGQCQDKNTSIKKIPLMIKSRKIKILEYIQAFVTFLENLQLNTPCYADEVSDLIDKYLSNLKCKK